MENKDGAQDLEGFDEIEAHLFQDLLPRMLSKVPADAVAENLTPEQRYTVLLTLSDDVLRQLSDSLVDALPESVRAEIRRRLVY